MSAQPNLFDNNFEICYNSILNPKQTLKVNVTKNDSKFIEYEIRAKKVSEIKSYILGLTTSRETAYKFTKGLNSLHYVDQFKKVRRYVANEQYQFAIILLKNYVKSPKSLQTIDRIIQFLERT